MRQIPHKLQTTVSTRAATLAAALAIAIAAFALGPPVHAAPVVDGEFDLTGNAQRLALGSDGNMWATLAGSSAGNDVARITPAGVVTEFDVPELDGVQGIVGGPDDRLWAMKANALVAFAPGAPQDATPYPAVGVGGQAITVGPDGNLWTANGAKVWRVTTAGAATSFDVLDPVLGQARGIAASGGLLWVVDFGSAAIVSVTTDGTPTAYPTGGGPQEVAAGLGGQIGYSNPGTDPHTVGRLVAGGSPLATPAAAGSDPFGVAFGADQAFWFAQPFSNGLGRLTADGVYSQLGGFSADSGPRYLAAGPSGTLWVALQGVGGNDAKKVARVSGLTPPTPATPPALPIVAPRLTNLRLVPRRFRVVPRRTPVSARSKVRRVARGTSIRFRLSKAATVRLAVERRVQGARRGGRCVKRTQALLRKKRCVRHVKAGRTLVRRNVRPGARRIAFSGRIGHKALKPGRYRLTAVAIDADGRRSAPRRAAFAVVR